MDVLSAKREIDNAEEQISATKDALVRSAKEVAYSCRRRRNLKKHLSFWIPLGIAGESFCIAFFCKNNGPQALFLGFSILMVIVAFIIRKKHNNKLLALKKEVDNYIAEIDRISKQL